MRRSWLIAAVAAIWLVSAVGGLWVLWIYENEAGVPVETPVQQSATAEDLLAANRPPLEKISALLATRELVR